MNEFDRVILIDDGKIMADCSPQILKELESYRKFASKKTENFEENIEENHKESLVKSSGENSRKIEKKKKK